MPISIPQPVLDILNSLQIAGLPASMNPGDIARAQINPGLEAFNTVSVGNVLGNLDLNLSNVVLTLTQLTPGSAALNINLNAVQAPGAKAPGATDMALLLEQVELSPPAKTHAVDLDPNATAVGGLPYLVPTGIGSALQPGTNVEGILGRMTGAVQQVEEMAGTVSGAITPVTNLVASLTGKITGALTGPQVLPAAPKITVAWRIEGKYSLLENTTLTDVAHPPVLVALPEFTELTAGSVPASELRIFCDVTVQVTLPDGSTPSTSRTLGPLSIEVPRVQIPTLAAFTENSQGRANFPGSVLMAVPTSSAIISLNNLKDILVPVQSILRNLQTVLKLANLVLAAEFGAASDNIGLLISFLGVSVAFIRGDQVMDLSSVTRVPGGWFGIGYQSWEDVISGVLLVGPPGRAITCHNRRNLWQGTGEFQVTLGSSATAFVPDLNSTSPACVPSDSTFAVVTPPINSGFPNTFNDVISSFQFLPLS
jgi:hypothetical protein